MGHINLSIKCHVIIVIKVSETRLPGHKFLFHPLWQCELGNHLLFPSLLKRDDHSISLTQLWKDLISEGWNQRTEHIVSTVQSMIEELKEVSGSLLISILYTVIRIYFQTL